MRTKLEAPDTVDGLSRVVGTRKNGDTHDGGCSCGFLTSGWERKNLAEARIQQHLDEHATGTTPPELADFLAEHQLGSTADLTPFPEG